jgi:hypothetical protein
MYVYNTAVESMRLSLSFKPDTSCRHFLNKYSCMNTVNSLHYKMYLVMSDTRTPLAC